MYGTENEPIVASVFYIPLEPFLLSPNSLHVCACSSLEIVRWFRDILAVLGVYKRLVDAAVQRHRNGPSRP